MAQSRSTPESFLRADDMIDKADVRSAIESARDLVMRVGHRDGPIDVIRLAHEAGVRVIEPANITADGYLGRQPDGTLVIRYRSQNAGNRNRFTIAHEIAHLVLANVQESNNRHDAVSIVPNPEEETAVNRIAAELLMPAGAISRALEVRGRDICYPRWRIVQSIARTFEVSTTALAFRLLELPKVNAISLRINIQGRGPRFPFDRSEGTSIRLVNGIEYEMERLWREAKKTTRHVIPLQIGGAREELHCDGIVRGMNSTGKNYWVIGWQHTDPEPTRSSSITNDLVRSSHNQ
jgi:Zn-dependent peptidase ImmA (M78 family)